MKFLKDLYRDTIGDLIEDLKETFEDIKSDLLQPFSEIVDEFKHGNVSSNSVDDDEDFDDYDGYCGYGAERSISSNKQPTKYTDKMVAIITIKGVYQMNGPKPFTRVIECPYSETGYYSQMMGNKSKQAQWIQANFPGANVGKGFSMVVNIK